MPRPLAGSRSISGSGSRATACGRTRCGSKAATHRRTRSATREGAMTETTLVSLAAVAGLGAFHGANPGMGWLFAVALGMQEGRRRAVWRALLPLGAGHAVSVGLALAIASTIGLVVPPKVLRWVMAAALLGLGVRQLMGH